MKSILLVSADTDHLIALSTLFAGNGYCVIAKPDGASALSAVDDGADIDLIISNYALPDMNGLNFFGALKAPGRDLPPVILFSDRVDVMTYLTALRYGVFEFLFSPVDSRELLRIVQVAIQGRGQETAWFWDRRDPGPCMIFESDRAPSRQPVPK